MTKMGFILTILTLIASVEVQGRRVKTKINVGTSTTQDFSDDDRIYVSIDACQTCNSGYDMSQVAFTGYDKPLSSDVESFFVTNNTDCILKSVSLDIEYLTLDSLQLHKRFIRLEVDVPPSETRLVSFKSWDKQNSFYYYLSAKPRRQATPFMVRFIPLSYSLLPKEEQ